MRTIRLRVTVNEVEPPVMRVLDVPAGALLPKLHNLLQAAIGWTDSHLHQFMAGDVSYGMPDTDALDDQRDETGVPLRALPARFSYLYDFGGGWEHEVEVTGAGSERPGVVAGEGACPPEDVGGPPGYTEFQQVLAEPAHPEHDHMTEWAGAWSHTFDLAATDLLVQQTAGKVPAPVRLLLDVAADGVKLTPGGRLPRGPWSARSRSATPTGIRSAARLRSRRTSYPWRPCTTCRARSACSAYAKESSPPPAPAATTPR